MHINMAKAQKTERKITFTDALRSVFSNYFRREGRATRSEFWYWLAFFYVTNVALGLLGLMEIGMVWRLLLIIPTLTLSIRRLHDLDVSGWWVILLMIFPLFLPLIGIKKGTEGENRFGPDPLGYDDLQKPSKDQSNKDDSIVIR